MKFISTGAFGWDHSPYWRYLDSVKGVMPPHLFAFASNATNHDLESPNSLHDSWLEYWRVSELTRENNKKQRSLQIDICLLGSRWDRHMYLSYKDVRNYYVQNPEELHSAPVSIVTHGDLLVHELVMIRDGLFSHEIVFDSGTVFFVQFADLEHRIELL